jgi:uncharacterized protein (TIGR03083 family)
MSAPIRHGVIDLAGYDLAGAVLSSWDAFVDLVAGADLSAPTRLKGWTVHDVAVHLGTWAGRSALTEVLVSLGSGGQGEPLDADAFNAAVVAAHRDADDAEVLAALRRSRDGVADLLASEIAAERGAEPVTSVLGPMPLLTVVHAGCYELALHGLDVADALGVEVDPRLLQHGIAALTDSTGCLAARTGVAAGVGIVADSAAWRFASTRDGGWTTDPITGKPDGPRVTGSATDLLEASSGRAEPVRLVARRRIKISQVGGLMALAPILDQVPGLPGGRGLAFAAKSLGGVGSLFRR